jgi:penicillin-binding protein 1A
LAYTIFPNGGWRPPPAHILDRIEDKQGKVVWQAENGRARNSVIQPEVAFEITSCLTDALTTGTGRPAYDRFGLKKFPAAGKTGTAYDFTDALFAGYDSQLTCVVWAGFDKPQRIYRGAFGSLISLPVWVKVMNASLVHYPPNDFSVPPGIHHVDICSSSGLLATDKCYDDIRNADGEVVKRRTSYVEWATDEQKPTDQCDVHSDAVRTQLVKKFENSQWPRAALAVDTTEVSPITMKGPTLVADEDPYDAVGSTFKPKTVAKAETSAPKFDPDKPVKRAIPVMPPTSDGQVEVRRAEPVRPIDETGREPLLQNDPPEPLDFGDDH